MTRHFVITLDNVIEWLGIERYPGPTSPVELSFPNLELRTDGIWIKPPDDLAAEQLTPAEYHILYRDHPTGDPTVAALPLPCTSTDFIKFIEWQGDTDFYLSEDSDFSPLPPDIKKALNTERAGSKLASPPKESREKWEKPGQWECVARNIGQEWMLSEEKKSGTRPGVTAIAKYIEGRLKDQDIRGRRGDYLDAKTIQREALKGITERRPKGKK